jgi:hypothetical protein
MNQPLPQERKQKKHPTSQRQEYREDFQHEQKHALILTHFCSEFLAQ